MHDLLTPEARRRLEALTLDVAPEDLARALYGPTWREAVRVTEGGGYRTTRDPLPVYLADLFAEVLPGVVAHDGRSIREGRSTGWRVREPSGSWRPAALEEIGSALNRDVVRLQDRAATRHAEAVERFRRLDRTARHKREEAREEASGEALRVALLSGVGHTVAALGRNLTTTLTALRDRLRLPEEALRAIAREWLETALDLGDLTPDARGRLAVADVRALYDLQARSGEAPLPLQTLYAYLDEILGPRFRRVEWDLAGLDDTQEVA